MCHFAATNLMQGKKVLYITLEMSEDQISKRIDANLLGIDIADIDAIPIKTYLAKINELKQRTPGKLIVREYPSGYGSVLHFRGLLQELRLKKKFVPDVIYIDYLNICSSARITKYAGGNSYEYVKCIAEEVRGLAIEQNLPIWSATQVNRSGAADSDYDITNISESFGIAHTADLLLGIINTEQLDSLGQMMVKQLKNRYNRPSPLRFIVGVDKAKMRLYDVEQSGQLLAHMQSDDKPLFDKTNTGQQIEQESKPFFQKNKAKFKPKF
jgi:replicative DNA helicase